jgi:hypothetical protein
MFESTRILQAVANHPVEADIRGPNYGHPHLRLNGRTL